MTESVSSPGLPILVVDDEPAIRRLFLRALATAGFTALEASDGEEALATLETTRVALVLLDSQMPGIGGVEAVTRLRARQATRTLPVILVTGQTDVSDRVRGLEAGATDYITKPVHLEELLARVRTHLRGQAAWSSALENELRRRAGTVAALGRIRPSREPEETAAAILDELVRLHDLDFALLLGFRQQGQVVPLAVRGRDLEGYDLRVGAPLPGDVAAHLQRHAAQGPWQEPWGLRGEHEAAYGHETQPAGLARTTCNAPLRSGERMIGVLVVSPALGDRTPAQEHGMPALSAVIDYAAIASALLAPGLEASERLGGARAVLEAVLAERAFYPVYQPIVELAERRIVGHEALTRFADGTRPDLRFTEAERVGLGFAFEAATLQVALEAAEGLPEEGWISVNVSPALVLEQDRLAALVASARRPLVLELTEHAPIADYAALRHALERLGPLVRVSVDDAGAGFASLRHILELRPAFVKLDLTLVREIDGDPVRQALAAGLVHFAGTTRSELIAEGIESEAELAALLRLGVRLGQGYLLGRPAPLDVAAAGAAGRSVAG